MRQFYILLFGTILSKLAMGNIASATMLQAKNKSEAREYVEDVKDIDDVINQKRVARNQTATISVHSTDYAAKLGYDCVSLIKYSCTIECLPSQERELKNRICFRDCTNDKFKNAECE